MHMHTPGTKCLIVLFLALALALSACARSGRQFDRTHVTDIQNGVQTKEQIRGWFGTPGQVTALQGHPAGCVERWTYVHAYASWGGARAQSAALVVDFDRNGKVCDHAYTETQK
jgi:outer membrane protein assembly factor BamE (lipoprotein component of BamABCDE complex)